MKENRQASSYEELLRRLESERLDISYRNPTPKPLVKVVEKVVKKVPEATKSLYFHAGRYAAGDRDKTALKAWQKYQAAEGIQ